MGSHGLVPHIPNPMSRDYHRPNYSCSATSCICNVMNTCISPSRCEIGKDGRCIGYMVNEETKEKTGD